jgi:hypothetical protein
MVSSRNCSEVPANNRMPIKICNTLAHFLIVPINRCTYAIQSVEEQHDPKLLLAAKDELRTYIDLLHSLLDRYGFGVCLSAEAKKKFLIGAVEQTIFSFSMFVLDFPTE